MKQAMIYTQKKELPKGWRWSTLGKECEINPRRGKDLEANDNKETSFVPMEVVDGNRGIISEFRIVPFSKVKKGYTYFEENDVLFAKITPCMQNKKSAIAKGLISGYGFGTTEFHVLRCKEKIIPKWVYYFIRNQRFIEEAENNFTGAVGQQRVPASFLENYPIIVPPIVEQEQIVDKLDKQMAQIDMMKKEAEKQLDAVITILESSLSYYLNEKNIFTGTILNFSDICSLDKKQIYPKSNEAMRLMYVGMEDIESNTGKITLNESIKWDSISSKTFYFNQNHVLYGKLRPYLNKVAEPYFEGRCSTELIPISPKSSCKRDYLAMLLRSSQTIQAAMKNKTGSRMPRADITEIMKLKIKLPDMNEQESILQKMKLFTSQLDEIRSTINIQLNAINQLPASILNKVFGQYQINS